jgi:hypothetical protein
MRFDASRALIAYSGVLTAACAWLLLGGASAVRSFDTIDVHRINLREDDGTIRMVISDRGHFPGLILHGREHPHPGRSDSAGMIFFNDEGTENGGLIFGGARTDGRVTSFGHLSFDQYDQDQIVALEQTEADGQRSGGLTVNDMPDAPLDLDAGARLLKLPPEQRRAEVARLRASGALGQPRGFFGKDEARDALLVLRDAQGHARLQLRVSAAGAASIDFLDPAGKIVRSVGA